MGLCQIIKSAACEKRKPCTTGYPGPNVLTKTLKVNDCPSQGAARMGIRVDLKGLS